MKRMTSNMRARHAVPLLALLALGLMGARGGCGPEPAITCDHYGITLVEGETSPAIDGCNQCTCTDQGYMACTEIACSCTGDEWNRDYKAHDPATCAVIRFQCAPHLFYFGDACGCGCTQAPWCQAVYDCEAPKDCSFEQTRCPFSTFGL